MTRSDLTERGVTPLLLPGLLLLPLSPPCSSHSCVSLMARCGRSPGVGFGLRDVGKLKGLEELGKRHWGQGGQLEVWAVPGRIRQEIWVLPGVTRRSITEQHCGQAQYFCSLLNAAIQPPMYSSQGLIKLISCAGAMLGTFIFELDRCGGRHWST